VGFLVLYVGLAIVVGVAASSRGRTPGGWFLLALVVSPLIAGLLVLVLPNLQLQRARAAELQDSRTCPYCAELIKAEAVVCKHCGKDVPRAPAASLEAASKPLGEAQPASKPLGVAVATIALFVSFGGLVIWAVRITANSPAASSPPIQASSGTLGSSVAPTQITRPEPPKPPIAGKPQTSAKVGRDADQAHTGTTTKRTTPPSRTEATTR
jgi:hypothetical protein